MTGSDWLELLFVWHNVRLWPVLKTGVSSFQTIYHLGIREPSSQLEFDSEGEVIVSRIVSDSQIQERKYLLTSKKPHLNMGYFHCWYRRRTGHTYLHRRCAPNMSTTYFEGYVRKAVQRLLHHSFTISLIQAKSQTKDSNLMIASMLFPQRHLNRSNPEILVPRPSAYSSRSQTPILYTSHKHCASEGQLPEY
jgi:hypothetical protein